MCSVLVELLFPGLGALVTLGDGLLFWFSGFCGLGYCKAGFRGRTAVGWDVGAG